MATTLSQKRKLFCGVRCIFLCFFCLEKKRKKRKEKKRGIVRDDAADKTNLSFFRNNVENYIFLTFPPVRPDRS